MLKGCQNPLKINQEKLARSYRIALAVAEQ